MKLATELAKEFVDQLNNLVREHGDHLTIGDINRLLKDVHGQEEEVLYKGIQDIAGKINSAKIAISEDAEKISDDIPDANLELDAVVKATEEAAHKIMDAAEAIQTAAAGVEGEAAEKINAEVTNLFQACDFQDITGQRISKVVTTLVDIEESVNELITAITGAEGVDVEKKKSEKKQRDTRPDADLMNGPQLEQDTPSQDDIDKLFAES